MVIFHFAVGLPWPVRSGAGHLGQVCVIAGVRGSAASIVDIARLVGWLDGVRVFWIGTPFFRTRHAKGLVQTHHHQSELKVLRSK